MRIVPIKDSVVCRKVPRKDPSLDGGIVVKADSPDLYEVLSFSDGDGFEFSVGDVVLPEGKGDEFEVSPGNSLFRFNVGKIMCRVQP